MKTIEDHNHDREQAYAVVVKHIREIWQSYAGNGIECPKCGGEMDDASEVREEREGMYWKDIACPGCGFRAECLA